MFIFLKKLSEDTAFMTKTIARYFDISIIDIIKIISVAKLDKIIHRTTTATPPPTPATTTTPTTTTN